MARKENLQRLRMAAKDSKMHAEGKPTESQVAALLEPPPTVCKKDGADSIQSLRILLSQDYYEDIPTSTVASNYTLLNDAASCT